MARMAATTMSTVRQRLLFMAGPPGGVPGEDARHAPESDMARLEVPSSLRWHYPDQVRGSAAAAPDLGRRCPSAGGRTSKISGAGAALSALCAPLSDVY